MNLHNYRPVNVDMPHFREQADWGSDPDSGAIIKRLTSAPAPTNNIYCEQPYCSPDGKRVLMFRTFDTLAREGQLLISDLEHRDTTMIEPRMPGEILAHHAWAEWAYYMQIDGSIRRVSLNTLQIEQVLPAGTLMPTDGHLLTISNDDQWLIVWTHPDEQTAVTYALNTRTGERRDLVNDIENLNPHGQMSHNAQNLLLYQMIRQATPMQVPIFLQEFDSGKVTQLPFGTEWSAESTGHMAFVGDTDQVAVVVSCDRENKKHDPRHPEGNLLIAGLGDEKPRVFPAPDCGFYHVSISKCGRYFVCDDFMHFEATGYRDGKAGPVRIVVGNLETNKYHVLLSDCQAYGIFGCSRSEPDPYFTTDNRHVIYNASPFGINQVFAAEVPEAFMRSLD